MQSYLFIGGSQDGINVPLVPDLDVVQLPAGFTERDSYLSETLTVGDAAIIIFRHESLTSQQVIDRLVRHYKQWAIYRPGSRR